MLRVRKNYERVIGELPRGLFDDKTHIILDDFGKYFTQFSDHAEIEVGPFKTVFFNFYHPKLPTDIASYYNKLIDNLGVPVKHSTTRAIVNSIVERKFAKSVGNSAYRFDSGDEMDIIPEVGDAYDRHKAQLLIADEEELFPEFDVEAALEVTHESGIEFRLNCINEYVRPLVAGDFVIAAGRPDTGKTSFLADQLTHMSSQLAEGRPVVWLNNESTSDRINLRLYQAALGADSNDLKQRSAAGTLKADYNRAVGGERRILVKDIHDWTNTQVELLLEALNPGLILFDMIDNVQFPGIRADARTDQVLESMYQWARTLAVKQECPIIVTSQISADGDGERWPAMHMLKDSKTRKQGAADLILMIGRVLEAPNSRFLSSPKNKLMRGNQNYLQTEVLFDMAHSRFNEPRML